MRPPLEHQSSPSRTGVCPQTATAPFTPAPLPAAQNMEQAEVGRHGVF